MKVHHTIIHEIIKEEQTDKARKVLSQEALDSSSENVINLVTELNDRYARKGGKHGVFNDEKSEPFDDAFHSYAKQITNEQAFIDFTKETTSELTNEIAKIAPAKGGFLVFSYYENYGSYVSVFIVRDKTGIQFERSSKRYNLKDAVHIDFEKMAMACRINVKAYKAADGNYLSFLQAVGDDLSKYFIRWINAGGLQTDKDDTRELLNLVQQIDVPENSDGEKQNRDEFHISLHSYITGSPGKLVNLRDISTRFYGNENYLLNYVQENEITISHEFRAHTIELKKLTRITANADNIILSFPQRMYKNQIQVSDDDERITITSAALVSKIKQHL